MEVYSAFLRHPASACRVWSSVRCQSEEGSEHILGSGSNRESACVSVALGGALAAEGVSTHGAGLLLRGARYHIYSGRTSQPTSAGPSAAALVAAAAFTPAPLMYALQWRANNPQSIDPTNLPESGSVRGSHPRPLEAAALCEALFVARAVGSFAPSRTCGSAAAILALAQHWVRA
eukprot:2231383-Pyramimonas_sp.AAC.1